MSELTSTPFEEFAALAALFARTRDALHDVVLRGRADAHGASLLADETLPHIEGIEAGFRSRLRSSEGGLGELRGLVTRSGLMVPPPRDDAEQRAALVEAMQALSGAGGPRQLVTASGRNLAALEHARIAMALLPATAPPDVHYPGRRSYADIAAPQGPGDFVARIEEVERTLWRFATGRPPRRNDAASRRVYAFFDAGAQLSLHGLPPA